MRPRKCFRFDLIKEQEVTFMKRLLTALLALIMILGLVSCGTSSEVPDDYMLVSQSNEIFNLYVPKSWQSNTDSGNCSRGKYGYKVL